MRRAPGIALLLVFLLALFGGATVTLAADPEISGRRAIDDRIAGQRLAQPGSEVQATRPSAMAASLLSARGVRQVVVRLTEEAVSEVAATGAGASAQRQAFNEVKAQQDRFIPAAPGAVLARTEIAVNAVVLEVDASQLDELAANPNVESISPVIDYELDLSETVPYIGATELHELEPSITGAGVTVAVLDSGVDYTHTAFGDLGTVLSYDDAYGADTADQANKVEPDWAQIADHTNIVGGFDFVGETWPNGTVRPDPDPIDCGGKDINPDPGNPPDPDALCEGGHGTHVSDIIGGINGVAPGVELHAVKVCSAVSTACSGVALLLGMDYALDPNGDGSTDDHVDVINMSLGSPYGQPDEDDLSQAVENATAAGVLTVASAGNSSDKPYVTGSPAAAPTALSVAQTAVPSATLPLLEIETPAAVAGSYPAVFQPWSEPLETEGALLNKQLQYGNGAGGNLNGCAAFTPGSLTGLVVLVDRGACDFSLKIANIAAGGADAGIIGLIAPGEPFEGSLGACPDDACSTIPGFMVHQSTAVNLKSGEPTPGTVVSLDPASGLDLEGTMVGSSSRGPTMTSNAIKPEIGAPGASISAEVGTVDGTTPFGGTSGAAPMVTGSAALLLQAFSERSPAEIKALLMNYSQPTIHNGAPQPPINSTLAAIQRIGAGEVRVNSSYNQADFAAWDSDAPTSALSFGFVDVTDAETELTRSVTVHNYRGTEATLEIVSSFRFENDETNGAVSVSHPQLITVPAESSAEFDVTLTIDGTALRDWTANSGASGASPSPLNLLEYDGFIHLAEIEVPPNGFPLHLPWHVLPRLSGETSAADDTVELTGETEGVPSGETALNNVGVGDSAVEGYSLIGESTMLPTSGAGDNLPEIDLRYAGSQTFLVPANVCSGEESFILALAVNTWQRQTHANAPASFEWQIDTDGDGDVDFFIFNADLALNLSDGRNVSWVQAAGSNTATPLFFTDHATNSANTTLFICAEDIGLSGEDLFHPLTADLLAFDSYFLGRYTDQILDIEFSPLGERFFPIIDGGFGAGVVPAGGSVELTALDFGVEGTNPSETGLLLFTDGTIGSAKTGSPQANEALVVRVSSDLPFDDILGHTFADDIVWAFENGITGGCSTNPPLFCPDDPVTRGQMAAFLDRALDLPNATADYFTDDNSSIFEDSINRVREAEIAFGCTATTYCPNQNVTRGQMAAFLDRALDLPNATADYFTDDNSSIFEDSINRVREAEITFGCTATKYCPNNLVTRGQMTAFLHRALGD